MGEMVDPYSTMYLPNKQSKQTTDARVWASEFFKITEGQDVDEATMTAWFANAIEAGRAAGKAAN